jgi:hypothetical protein
MKLADASRPTLFTVPNRQSAVSCQQIADELIRQSREEPEAEVEFSDEDLKALSAILNQPVDEVARLCH